MDIGGNSLTYLGHSTFLIETEGREKIIIDPWLEENPQTPEDLKRIAELDTILVTHGHHDHFGDVIPLARKTGARVVANFEISSYLLANGIENVHPMQKGGPDQVGEIKVTVTDAIHASSIAEEDGTIVYAGEPGGYLVEFRNGFELYHAGDTGLFGDMRLIGDLYAPDLAILPIGGRVLMGPFEAAHAASFLKVNHVIPMHYGTTPFPVELAGTPEQLRERLEDISPETRVYALKPGESWEQPAQ